MKKTLLLITLLAGVAACSQTPSQAPIAPVVPEETKPQVQTPKLVENEVLNDMGTQALATDFGHIFIDRDMTFKGTLPCDTCQGIAYQLNILQDGRFEARQDYQSTPEVNLVKGTWLLEERTLHLLSQSAKLPSFQFVSNNKLVRLDEAGKPVVSSTNFELTRSLNFEKLDTKRNLLGLYEVNNNQASFTSCLNAERYPIAMTQHHVPMLRSYQQNKQLQGKPVIATAQARLGEQEPVQLFIEQFDQFWPGASCPEKDNIKSAEGIVWQVERIEYIQVPQEYNLRLVFADNRITGFAGCNAFNGQYSHKASVLKIEPLATTRKYCATSNYYETNLLKRLQSADRMEVNGQKLQLFINNNVVLELSPALH